MARPLGRQPAFALLAAAVVASGGLLLHYASNLSFQLDDWDFLLGRRGLSAHVFLDPHGEHISIIPIAVYKLLLTTFGMESAFPFHVASTGVFLAACVLLFIWLRRRVGDWLALIGTVLILFLGGGFEDLLWDFQIGYFGSLACGLGMLLALERRDRLGDRLACLLLTVSIAFSSLGLPFAAAAVLDVALRGESRRRAYVAALPLALYALWWIGWGHHAHSALSLHNVATTPEFVLDAVAANLSSLLGLGTPTPYSILPGQDWTYIALSWGRPLLAVAVLAAGWRLIRLGRVPVELWVVASIGASFWVLAGFDVEQGRTAVASRYQVPGAIFVLLIAAELLRGVRLGRRALAALAAVSIAAAAAGVYYLHQADLSFEAIGQVERADLGALDLVRGGVTPGFVLAPPNSGTPYLNADAAQYFSAADAYGSPGYSPAEIVGAPPAARAAADGTMAAALGLGLTPGPSPGSPGGCERIEPRPGFTSVSAALPAGGVLLRANGSRPAAIGLSRFATGAPSVQLGKTPPRRWMLLRIARDAGRRPWMIYADTPLDLCPPPPA